MEKQREREQRLRAGLDTKDLDEEDDEDFMGIAPLIEKLEMKKSKVDDRDLMRYEEPTDSESDDDERFTPDAINKRAQVFDRKFKRHKELLKNFVEAETLDDAFKWMYKIDKFEERHFPLRPEYRVIGELMNRLKVAEGKDKFVLQMKLNRALRLVEWREAYDPNDPANYGVLQSTNRNQDATLEDSDSETYERNEAKVDNDSDDEEEYDDMKEKDDILLEKINAIDQELEKKLAELHHTFGRKGKLLEEEIRDLAEERNALTEKKRTPLYRKGFDAKVINVNRSVKVTTGGRVAKYSAIVACGNYNGVIGFAKGRGPKMPVAVQKAHEKCFQNLHYVERYEEHTIPHAIQTNYKKTKIYLWPAPTRTGVVAGRKIVQTILSLAGFKNVKTKVVGSRNPFNTVKALFKALTAIETPKDVQEKFGRTVVEKHLL